MPARRAADGGPRGLAGQDPARLPATGRRPPQLSRAAAGRGGDRRIAAGLSVARRRAGSRPGGAGPAQPQRRRDLGTAMGRAPLRAQPLQRAARGAGRARRPPASLRGGVPGLRRRAWLPLQLSATGRTAGSDHRRGTHRVRHRPRCDRLVDSRRRTHPLRIPVPTHAAARGAAGAHAVHPAQSGRPAPGHPRGGPGRLRRDVVAPRRRPAPACATVAVGGRLEGPPRPALRHTVAHAADQRHRWWPGRFQPDPQPQRTQRPGRRELGAPGQVHRRVVVDAPEPGHLGARPQACRHHRQHPPLHRLRRSARLSWRAGRRLEPRLGRQLGRPRRRLRLHPCHRGLRHRCAQRLRGEEERAPDRPPRDRLRGGALRRPARCGAEPVRATGRGHLQDRLRLRRRTGGPAQSERRPAVARMARRPVHGPPPSQGGGGSRQAPPVGQRP
ncbi:hypothetical protein NB689_002689 [Xanthomonas sacchari]|nr:hypothetical protein [Xanthomonas sacchari]